MLVYLHCIQEVEHSLGVELHLSENVLYLL